MIQNVNTINSILWLGWPAYHSLHLMSNFICAMSCKQSAKNTGFTYPNNFHLSGQNNAWSKREWVPYEFQVSLALRSFLFSIGIGSNEVSYFCHIFQKNDLGFKIWEVIFLLFFQRLRTLVCKAMAQGGSCLSCGENITHDTHQFLHNFHLHQDWSLHKKATINQVTTMLATSKNVLFPGHNHLLTTGANDPTLLIITLADARPINKVLGHQLRLLADGYDLEMGHFCRWLAWWLPIG